MSFEDDEYWDYEYNDQSPVSYADHGAVAHDRRAARPEPAIDELAARRNRRSRVAGRPPEREAPARGDFDTSRPGWLDHPDFVTIDTTRPAPDSEVVDFNRPEFGADFDNPEFPGTGRTAPRSGDEGRRRRSMRPAPDDDFDYLDPGYDHAAYAADMARFGGDPTPTPGDDRPAARDSHGTDGPRVISKASPPLAPRVISKAAPQPAPRVIKKAEPPPAPKADSAPPPAVRPRPMPGPPAAGIKEPERPLMPLSAGDLEAIRWRLDGGTLREVVDHRAALRDLGARLDEPLAREQDHITRSGLLSVRAEVYRLLGELGMAAGAGRLALAHAEAAADVQAIVIAQAELAHVLRLRGDFAEADRLFEEAASSEAGDALRSVVHENAGRSCFDQGRHMEALDHFARAVWLGRADDMDLVERIGVCLEAVYIHVLRDGWGPYPRLRREILGPIRAPHTIPAAAPAKTRPEPPV